MLDYSEFVKVLKDVTEYKVPPGVSNKFQRKRLAQLSIIVNEENASEFAVIFSMSQIVADGYIYYLLLNMINGNRKEVKVISLSIAKLTILKQVTIFSLRKILYWFYGSKKAEIELSFVNNYHIARIKNQVHLALDWGTVVLQASYMKSLPRTKPTYSRLHLHHHFPRVFISNIRS